MEGHTHSDSAKAKMSASATGRVFTSEHKVKLSKARIGAKHSEATKAKMSQSALGKKFSLDHRIKLSQAKLGKSPSEETRRKLSIASAKAVADGRLLGNGQYNPQPYTDRLGRYIIFKNTWEYGAAVYLDSQGWNWFYEQAPIVYNGETYLPDFFIWDDEGDLIKIIEVKGRYEPDTQAKMGRFKEYFNSCGIEWELWNGKRLKELGILHNVNREIYPLPKLGQEVYMTNFAAAITPNGGI